MKQSFRMILMWVALLVPAASWAQSFNYLCNFDDPADTTGWHFVHSSPTSGWCIDSTVAFNGTHSLFVTNPADSTHPNTYETSTVSASYAYREIALPTGLFTISYMWRAQGEGSYDYLRVFLAPRNATLTGGLLPDGTTSSYAFRTALPPQGWIALDGGIGLNGQSSWRQYSSELFVQADTFKLVFLWCCDGSAGTQPPAAVDSIHIVQPDCSRPVYPTLTNLTSTTFDLSWIDVNGSVEWIVELDSAGQQQGQGSVQSVFDTVAYFTGLTANTQYTVHVAAICSSGDTSNWMTVGVRTPCNLLTTLPYTESFENAPIGGNTSNNFVNCWYRLNNGSTNFGWPYVQSATDPHSGSKALYWYDATTLGTHGDYQCIVLPGVDTTIHPINSLQLTFWARATGTSYSPVFIVGVMSNPNDINTFVPVQTVPVNTTQWTPCLVDFSSYVGGGNFVAIRANRPASSWYAYVDDITLEEMPNCPTVCNITANQVGSAGAQISWNLLSAGVGTVTGYELQIDSVGASTPATITTTGTERNYMFTYLEPGTQYIVRVRAVCDGDSVGHWDSLVFSTFALPCAVADPSSVQTVVFSNSTTTASGVPVYSSYGNTICQSIYTAAELNAAGLHAGVLSSLTLGYSTAGSYSKDITIYIGTTTRSTFGSVADQLPLNSNMTKVCGPVLRPNNSTSEGWVNYPFTTPFTWDGVSNLVITIFVNQHGSSQSSSGFYGYATSAGSTRTIYRYRDGTAYTADNCTSGTSNTSSYRPSVSFSIYNCVQSASCARPMVMLTRNQADTVELRWAPGYQETSWNIQYKAMSDTGWTLETTGHTDLQYTFTTLNPSTEYQVRVYPSCGGDSIYTQLQFTTPCVAIDSLPFIEDFENFTATSTQGSAVTNCWHRLSSYSYTASPYLSSSYVHSGARSLYYYTPSSYHSVLVLPPFAAPLDSLQVSFAAYATAATYDIKVGVMSDPNDYSTFTTVAAVRPSQLNQWEMFEVLLDSCPACENAHYIALAQTPTGSSNYMYIDDVEVDYIPPCPRPNNITFSGITTTSALMRWSSPAGELEVEYGPAGFTRGSGTTLVSTDDSLLLYGLEHSTRYEVYARALCPSGDTSYWSFVSYFTTACSTIDTLPYKQNFSNWGIGTTARPACWTFSTASSYPYIINVTGTDGTTVTGQTLNMYCYNNQLVASLPELDSVYIPANTVRTVFQAWTSATSDAYSHSLMVGLCSTPGDISTFTPFDTVEVTHNPRLYEVAFDSVAGVGRYVSFVSIPVGGASYNYVYLDSVAVSLLPACQAPNHLSASNTLFNSTTLAWNGRGTATTWQIEYGPAGFAHGHGIREVVSVNPYVLNNINPSTSYEYYVRSICGAGDTSEWSYTPCEFTTQQIPAAVPYFYDFEADTEWYNWQTNSNTTVNWYRDTAAGDGTNGYGTTGIHSLYISADSGLTCSTNMDAVVNAVAYRDFDFGNDPYSSYLLSFRARSGGTTTQAYDGLMVLLVNPNTPVVASHGNITSPWGDYTVLSPLATIRSNSNWNTYSALLDTMTGIHRLAFYWFNQSTGAQAFSGAPASVDDVRIEQVGCPRPTNVRATSVSVTMVDLEWNGPDTGKYRVHCRAIDGSATFVDSVYTNRAHFSGLAPGTQYSVQVRRLCSATDSSTLSPAASFITPLCTGGYEDTIGDVYSTTTSSYFPLATNYRYSYTQQIVRSSELSGAGEIAAINFRYYYSTGITSKINCTIYMGHTSMSSFSSTSDFVAPDSLQVVYVGRLNASQGWNRIILQDPFTYNGIDNIVIAIDDNSNASLSSSYAYYISSTPATQSLCFYSSTVNPNPSSRATLDAFTGTKNVYATRNQMILEVCPQNPCASPQLRTPMVRTNSVTLRWRNTSERYDFSYRRATTTSWIVDGLPLTDTVHVLTALSPMTDYVYRVRQYCDSTGVSNWSYGRFNTGDLPCLPPETVSVVSVTNTRVKIRWSTDENNVSYNLHVFNSVFDREIPCYVNTGTCSGLEAGRTYYAAVQTTCSGTDVPSEWSDTISFVTDVCPDVSNVVVSDVQGNSAVIDWTEGGRAEQWEIQFGEWGFGQGYGTSVIVDTHPYTLTNLIGSTTYDVYVRAICGSNFVSEHWSQGESFTTLYSSIGSVTDDARVRLYPNPTSADVELMLPTTTDAVKVEVLDVTGRVCQRHTLQANTERFVIPASLLSQGTYFVRIAGGDINAVKKLVVR